MCRLSKQFGLCWSQSTQSDVPGTEGKLCPTVNLGVVRASELVVGGKKKSGKPQPDSSRTSPHRTAGAVGGDGDAPLVSRCISERSAKPKQGRIREPDRLEVLPADIKVIRDYGPQPQPEHLQDCRRGEIEMFSRHAAKRLTETARNAFPELVTQMVLTYHDRVPDGVTAKKHLHSWLMALGRACPGVGYLWILEFQTRGAPHFHVWITAPYSEALWKRLGAAWNRIADPDSPKHLWWHTEERFNRHECKVERSMIPWDMKGAGYLRKYMSKEAQKCVPEGFGWVGRFWGSSRNLVPEPIVYEASDLPIPTTQLTRTLSKWVEARRRKGREVGRKVAEKRGKDYHPLRLPPTARGSRHSTSRLNNATPVLLQLLERLDDEQ